MTTTELTGAEDVAWDLSDLYDGGDDPRIEQDVEQTEAAAAAFRERYYGHVAQLSPGALLEAIEERERIESTFTRAIYYAHLWFATDMNDSQRGALVARLTEKGAAVDTQLLFFGLEIAAFEDDHAEALLASDELESWRHWLRTIRKFRPYVLSEPEEKILTEKSVSGFAAWDRLYDELLGAIKVELDDAEIGFEEAMSKLYSPDRDLRRRASEAVTEALAPGLKTRTYVFNTIAVDKSIDDRLRGYATWISSRNLSNDTTDEAVEALVDAVVGRYDVVQRYYTLKAKLLGLDRLSFYDRMAPLAEDTTHVEWSDARQLVLDAFADFSNETGDVITRFFDENWIDAPPRDGKRPGAFCATNVPGVHPYVFMNYTGDRRSVLTLAHELGHGLHGYLAQPLGFFNASSPLTTAETASVFAEALTFKRLLAVEEDPQRRLNLLAGRIEDSIATVYRQIAMNRFEHAVHTTRRDEGELSTDTFEELWLASQQQLFGDSVDTDGYATWWSYIPHFIGTPGYVYAYSYGFLFALSIFRKYELEGESMVEPYLDLLRAGGSKTPEELAEMVGLDLTDRKIWDAGIDALAVELDEAEALAVDLGLS
ncbi:MAG TPA: M3 family oligoendopeptidase [Gaiellaceae bacterium]|nr:M3 family oligoendopeptidase [Gaiellaceae bacterium]